jgi:hypothetical protein
MFFSPFFLSLLPHEIPPDAELPQRRPPSSSVHILSRRSPGRHRSSHPHLLVGAPSPKALISGPSASAPSPARGSSSSSAYVDGALWRLDRAPSAANRSQWRLNRSRQRLNRSRWCVNGRDSCGSILTEKTRARAGRREVGVQRWGR